MFVDDIVTILTAAGVGTFNMNIFESSKASIPPGPGPYLTISETGGSGPEGTHNAASAGFPAYVRPNAQILVRGVSYSAARMMADNAYSALFPIRNQYINGVFWRQIVCLQEPFDFGLDDLTRPTIVFNIACTKRRDAASSVEVISTVGYLSGSAAVSGLGESVVASLLAGIVAYWKLDEASGIRADSVGTNPLTDTGTNSPTQVAGKIATAAHFAAASNQWLTAPSSPALVMGDIDFTFAFWINFTTADPFTDIVGKFTAGSYEYVAAIDSISRFSAEISATGSSSVTTIGSTVTAVPGTWYYVIVWHDSVANTFNIQVNDGVVHSAPHSAGVFAGTSPFQLGRASTYVDGTIDELALWKRTLTSAERTLLYNAGAGRTYPF
jgi:hypothetical protein